MNPFSPPKKKEKVEVEEEKEESKKKSELTTQAMDRRRSSTKLGLGDAKRRGSERMEESKKAGATFMDIKSMLKPPKKKEITEVEAGEGKGLNPVKRKKDESPTPHDRMEKDTVSSLLSSKTTVFLFYMVLDTLSS